MDRMPAFFRSNHEKWRELNPDWEVKLWSDSDMLALVRQSYPQWLPLFSGWRSLKPVQMADLFRVMLLETFGGVYVDMDVEPLKPMDELLTLLKSEEENPTCVLGQEPFEHAVLLENRLHFICNAFMASERGHKLWGHVLQYVWTKITTKKAEWGDPVAFAGPRALTTVVEMKPGVTDDCVIVKPQVFYPTMDSSADLYGKCLHIVRTKYWRRERLSLLHLEACRSVLKQRSHDDKGHKYPKESFAVHHWAHTWIWRPFQSRPIIDASEHAGPRP